MTNDIVLERTSKKEKDSDPKEKTDDFRLGKGEIVGLPITHAILLACVNKAENLAALQWSDKGPEAHPYLTAETDKYNLVVEVQEHQANRPEWKPEEDIDQQP